MKALAKLSILALACASQATAQTAFTAPSGYVKVTLPASSGGTASLSAVSAALLNEVEFSGAATINSNFSSDTQTLSVSGTPWTDDQWISTPHVVYITDAPTQGAEEAFLITDNTDSTLTLRSTFDLRLNDRFPESSTVTIRKAHTIGSLFGRTAAEVKLQQFGSSAFADSIFIWNGSSWVTYFFTGSEWNRSGGAGASDPADDVVFPDEGFFMQRKGTSDLELTFFGDVPVRPQISTIPGNAANFVASRYPVATAIQDMGFEDIPGWQRFGSSTFADKVFRWTGTEWITYFNSGSAWELIPGNSGLSVNDPIPANTALFISRISSGTEGDSPAVSDLPYSID